MHCAVTGQGITIHAPEAPQIPAATAVHFDVHPNLAHNLQIQKQSTALYCSPAAPAAHAAQGLCSGRAGCSGWQAPPGPPSGQGTPRGGAPARNQMREEVNV